MLTYLRPAVALLVLLTLLTGIAYPLAITGAAQVLLPGKANGSLVTRQGAVLGSKLIGQAFISDRYFHGRPSAAGVKGYDAAASSGSNLGPLSKKLADRVDGDVAAVKKTGASVIPADAVTASASGLDPHISPQNAALQIERIAAARKVPIGQVKALVDRHTEHPFLGLIGEPRINVLKLNLALDETLSGGAG